MTEYLHHLGGAALILASGFGLCIIAGLFIRLTLWTMRNTSKWEYVFIAVVWALGYALFRTLGS